MERSHERDLPISLGYAFDRIDTPIFTIGRDRRVIHWNAALEQLSGVSEPEAQSKEMASQAMYPDDRRQKLLADKVLEAPRTAHEQFDIERAEANGIPVYRDETQFVAQDGSERHIRFSAVALYRDEELVGVAEMVTDRTEDVMRAIEMEALVEELESTVSAIMDGDKSARATFSGDGHVDQSLVAVQDELNALADQFEQLSTHVVEQVEDLERSAESVTETTVGISDAVVEQSERMQTVDDEVADLSATIEEIASTADEIERSGVQAEELVESGQNAADHALTAMNDLDETTDAVRDDVEQLHDRITEIDEIVAVIDEIADQTNLLALNANIQAARSNDTTDGFLVIANEIKSLAEESKEHAEDIEATVRTIQSDASGAVDEIADASMVVDDGIEQVETVQQRFESIVDAVQETSQGIQEISTATDTQAASTNEIATMVDQASRNADAVATDVRTIPELTESQRNQIADIRSSLERYTV
ncbi:methyl-accepting chemotaxis protein [Natrarchaeobius halalkaliphilus]|uniref:methyl-accepting chemotaxis protein n=1 Tax=Natrarchaeobius halalkaliphilus TaxID=1679091 RepID=UPI001404C2F1|nr:methyl-accepting chemotaxis protein [Natrarchaeobius halalkaliphilus]